MIAVPRYFPFERAMPSSVTRMSAPWQLAWTITARSMPRIEWSFCRPSKGPPFTDAVPFGRALVEIDPERVLWGTDWPHPNLKTHMPDDGDLVDLLPAIAPTAALQRQLLVDNPARLYWE